MALITENGWPQVPRSLCDNLLVPGTTKVRPELRKDDVTIILVAWACWFDRNVRNIEPPDGHRNWWAWSATNDVWNSNHLSGTALDLCADELPWQRKTMPQNQVEITNRGIALFEGTVFWGRNWSRTDEMHFQVGLPPTSPKIREFADRLRNGYLNIFGPADPNAFPLPLGYYYGPLDGPVESISGEYESDSQAAKDGLGRWQAALGLPVTKKWNDGLTPRAAYVLQRSKGWLPNPLFGYGGVYAGEWDAVIREGWRLPANTNLHDVEIPDFEYPLTKWGDYSQYQAATVDDSYPYEVISFRASIANQIDTKWLANMKAAQTLVRQGKLKKIIAYHFWVPGADNWGTFRQAIELAGGVTKELCFMIDVEDGGTKWNIRGDQTAGVKSFIASGQTYFQNPQAASIYWNPTANPDLLVGINDRELRGVKLIVPRYAGPDKAPWTPDGVQWFGHQYSDRENTPPFGPTDINQAKMPLSIFLAAWGANGGPTPDPDDGAGVPSVPVPPVDTDSGVVIPDWDDERVLVAIGAQFDA
ncbi:endolysin [Mycobacterium phage Phabba]|uniref:Lysin A n=1 Tax=Mycobacterium phage Phabba TaxID=2027899 RepID=A0A249XT09_9CAUD|nr:endolysin [Mycobacterium phage Phabba]ASZ74790.1 lysin A [Mycobacterium phage Phabba]